MLCILLLCLFLCVKVGKRENSWEAQRNVHTCTQPSVPSPFTSTLNAYTMHILFVFFYVIFLSKSESAFDDDDIPLKKKTRSSYCIITWLPSFPFNSFSSLFVVDSLSISLTICVKSSFTKVKPVFILTTIFVKTTVFPIFSPMQRQLDMLR